MTNTPEPDHFAIIIGAGFGGIGMGVALDRAGINDFLIVEKSAGPGGVWHDNRYPGAACDVPSHLYSFSFEPKADWSRRYAPQPEIRDYLEHCWTKYGLEERTRLGVAVDHAEYDEAGGCWRVELSDGTRITSRMLIPACGQLNVPVIPPIPGLESFPGPVFHSARWDSDIDLTDKRIGVIGTGASAIQFIPEIADVAKSVVVFQRSPAYVLPKPDRPYTDTDRRRFARWPWWQKLCRWAQFWSHESRGWFLLHARPLLKTYTWKFRRLLENTISDPETRAALMPGDVIGCKRILFSNRYLQAIEAENVELVSEPVERVDADAVEAAGATRHFDVLVLGTGFAATDLLSTLSIVGRGGIRLSDSWADGAHGFHGMSVPGFPNLFSVYGPNTNLGHNSIIYILEGQMAHIADAARWLRDHPGAVLDIDKDTEAMYDRQIQRQLKHSIWASGCQNWYQNAAGRIVNNWPGLAVTYRRMIARFRPDSYL